MIDLFDLCDFSVSSVVREVLHDPVYALKHCEIRRQELAEDDALMDEE